MKITSMCVEADSKEAAVGVCPACGEYPTWFNDMPLRAYCHGTKEKPHREYSRIVPGKTQPYCKTIGHTVWKTTDHAWQAIRQL